MEQNLIKRKLLSLIVIWFLGLLTILFLIPLADSHSNLRISDECRDGRCRSARSSDNNDDDSQTVNGMQESSSKFPKLLIILIDGFRWDYYTRQKSQMPGFTKFLSDGIQASWVDPIFPSLSFPTWNTIATGRYPEEHNILGNYMLYRPTTEELSNNVTEAVFQLKDNSTRLPFWWQWTEPIWTTVTRNNRKVYLANWARCDVPYQDILPTECTGYTYQDINHGFRDSLQTALTRLQKGYSLAMAYDDLIDHAGHQFGPDSKELKFALLQRDTEIRELLFTMQLRGLTNKINIVITSDHGMTNLNQTVKRVFLQDYLNLEDVHRIVDYGPVVGIAAMDNRTEMLVQSLAKIPSTSVVVYSKENIPQEFHYKRGKFVLDFLLVATPGNFIVGVKGEKQIPNDEKSSSPQPYQGVHGYHNMKDMRTVFFAKGPAFKKGKTTASISVVDQYQIFMKLLNIPANPHHGNWSSVKDMFSRGMHELE